MAYKASQDIYNELLMEEANSKTLCTYIARMTSINNGFTYNLCFNDVKKQLTGVVFMTSVMRSNFERFGTYIFIDAMKRKTNNFG